MDCLEGRRWYRRLASSVGGILGKWMGVGCEAYW